MKSISLDNPYLLLIAIPLLLLTIIPYILAIKKENKSKSTIASLIIHLFIVAVVSVAFSGLHQTTVKTETEVFVVADVSYSSSRNYEQIDEYIRNLDGNLPPNSKVGVVCFGKDQQLLTDLGGIFTTVSDNTVDTSKTDIASALEYTAGMFSEDAIKRIVLITDSKENSGTTAGGLISAVKALETQNIYIDAIYVDSNLKDGDYEVQINDIDYTPSTYLNHKSTLQVLIQSNSDYIPNLGNKNDKNDAFVRLFDSEGNLKAEVTKQLQKGFNIVNIELDTSVGGSFDYKVVVDANHDVSDKNNVHAFTQTITEKLQVLLISKTKSDLRRAEELYEEKAEIYAPLLLKRKEPVPYSIEELCKYDEIIISDMDIKEIENTTTFLHNLDVVVSKFGKSLITAGNTFIQNQDDEIYKTLEDMLAIKYGNSDGDPKLYALVIDSSRSMQDASQLIMAKESAIQLLNMMSKTDYVMVITVSGEVTIAQRPTSLIHKEEIIQIINSIKPTQGTVLGAGLRVAYEQMKEQPFSEKYVMLISDGRSYAAVNERDDAISIASTMKRNGIYTSVINTASDEGADFLTRIQKSGGGKYYYVKSPEAVKDVVSTDIADDITQSVIENDTVVNIEDYNDPLVDGVVSLPNIKGYYYGKVKSNVTVVLSVDYEKPSGDVVRVPIYSYWNYGDGRVTSISTTFSGKWVEDWEDDNNATEVYQRILITNTPKERIDYPFMIDVIHSASGSVLEIIPAENNPDVIVSVTLVSPNGDETKNTLYYVAGSYKMSFDSSFIGKYKLKVVYEYGEESFEANTSFDVAYEPEYNSFEIFDASLLYNAIVDGTVSENGELKIENDENEVDTYVYYYTIYLMALAIVLYVIDVIIRKIKLNDIKSFFNIGGIGGKAK
ncbi:MAG: VWA domain-containing protein [Clostridia bacterium]|nr:VWA domain-containing protein [Clostridia bacterium]